MLVSSSWAHAVQSTMNSSWCTIRVGRRLSKNYEMLRRCTPEILKGNKGQSNWAIDGNRRHHCKSQIPILQISPSRGPGLLSNTMLLATTPVVPVIWHLIPSNGFSRVHECDRWTDRWTYYSNICHNTQNCFQLRHLKIQVNIYPYMSKDRPWNPRDV